MHALALACVLAAAPLPSGWRTSVAARPTACVGIVGDPFTAVGDFDGDGKEDLARLLTRGSDRRMALWVWLTSETAPRRILETEMREGSGDFAIGRASAGVQRDATGDVAVHLRNDGVLVMVCESSAQIVYVEPRTKAPRTVWVAD